MAYLAAETSSRALRAAAERFFIMPKLTGPLLGMSARGTLSRILTFVTGRRGTVVKRRRSPQQPQTFPQLYRRWMFAFCQQNWAALELVDRQSWADLADEHNVSNINAYLGTNLERWDNWLPPSAYLPIQQTGSPGTVNLFTAAMQNNRIWIQLRVSPIAQNWGMILYFERAFPPLIAPENVIQLHLQNDNLIHDYYVYGVAPGIVWFKVSLFSHNGERYDYPIPRAVTVP